jgi:hypothetical protein
MYAGGRFDAVWRVHLRIHRSWLGRSAAAFLASCVESGNTREMQLASVGCDNFNDN